LSHAQVLIYSAAAKYFFLFRARAPSIKVGAAQTFCAKEKEKIQPWPPQNRRLLRLAFAAPFLGVGAVNQTSAMDYFAAFVSKV